MCQERCQAPHPLPELGFKSSRRRWQVRAGPCARVTSRTLHHVPETGPESVPTDDESLQIQAKASLADDVGCTTGVSAEL